jgi:FtsP/CotA-like multicopper oxidase with cupredoxin domain
MTQLNRRQFATLATAGVLLPGGVAQAEAPLTHLTAGSRILEVKGKAAKVYGITDKNGRPGLNMLSNGQFAVRLSNGLDIETLVHWHGLTPPLQFDGTPHLSGPVLAPGETRDYVFKSRDTGTHWMHSHVGLQEQQMLAAPLIIRETDSPLEDEQEHVVLLHDFTFRDPQDILAELQKGGGGHAAHMGQPMGGGHDMKNMDTMKMDTMGAGMAMMNDIVFDALLANDRTLDDPEVVPAEKGGRFRLRLINGAAASNMWVDLGGIEGTLIAVDGRVVAPVRGSRFPLAIAQRADIRLTLPAGSGAWPILFQAEGSDLQAGIVLRAGDGAVAKLSDRGTSQPALDLSLERHLRTQIVRPEIAVSRQEFVMLTGGGADYVWGLNGRPMMHDILFKVREGERYQVTFHNMTGMAHPMHFHGHYFKVVGIGMAAIDGALRDTVLVPPDEMVTVEFDAGNPGTWALHCHHIYHMNSGMMGAVAYESAA